MRKFNAEEVFEKVTGGRLKGKDLIVTPEGLKDLGFAETPTRGSCVYYTKSDCEYAIASVWNNEYGEYSMVLMPEWLPSKIGYCSIFFNRKKCGDDGLMPTIIYKGKNKSLHRVMMEIHLNKEIDKDCKYDHINVCRSCCTIDNIREATDLQNSGNMFKSLERIAYSQEDKIYLQVKLTDTKKIQRLKNLGLRVNPMNDDIVGMSSPEYPDREMYYRVAKTVQMIIYGKYLYNILNDFKHEYGMHLLVHQYVLKDITKEEACEFNYQYYKSTVWNEELFKYAITEPLAEPYSLPKIA